MTGRISQISSFGIVTIKFNCTLFKANFSEINSTNTKIILLAANQRDQEVGFNKTDIDFIWDLLSFSSDQIQIQLNFSNPNGISPLLDYDYLKIDFSDSCNYFVNINTNLILDKSSWILIEKIIPQLVRNDITKMTSALS